MSPACVWRRSPLCRLTPSRGPPQWPARYRIVPCRSFVTRGDTSALLLAPSRQEQACWISANAPTATTGSGSVREEWGLLVYTALLVLITCAVRRARNCPRGSWRGEHPARG